MKKTELRSSGEKNIIDITHPDIRCTIPHPDIRCTIPHPDIRCTIPHPDIAIDKAVKASIVRGG